VSALAELGEQLYDLGGGARDRLWRIDMNSHPRGSFRPSFLDRFTLVKEGAGKTGC